MSTGIVSGAWGYSPQQVAGMSKVAEFGDSPLTYQLGLNSRPPINMVSPLTVANKGFYSTSFGKKRSEIVYLKKQIKNN